VKKKPFSQKTEASGIEGVFSIERKKERRGSLGQRGRLPPPVIGIAQLQRR